MHASPCVKAKLCVGHLYWMSLRSSAWPQMTCFSCSKYPCSENFGNVPNLRRMDVCKVTWNLVLWLMSTLGPPKLDLVLLIERQKTLSDKGASRVQGNSSAGTQYEVRKRKMKEISSRFHKFKFDAVSKATGGVIQRIQHRPTTNPQYPEDEHNWKDFQKYSVCTGISSPWPSLIKGYQKYHT